MKMTFRTLLRVVASRAAMVAVCDETADVSPSIERVWLVKRTGFATGRRDVVALTEEKGAFQKSRKGSTRQRRPPLGHRSSSLGHGTKEF